METHCLPNREGLIAKLSVRLYLGTILITHICCVAMQKKHPYGVDFLLAIYFYKEGRECSQSKFPLVIRSYSAVGIQRLERTDQEPEERAQLEKCPVFRLKDLGSIPFPMKSCHTW